MQPNMSTDFLSLDFETRSVADLRKTGVYVYAEHPSTDIWCAAFSVNGAEPSLWRGGEPVPKAIREAVEQRWEIRAWNAMFERILWTKVACLKHGWPVPLLTQFRCTAAEAAAMSLPRKLGDCAEVLGLSEKKDKAGHALMLQLCKPRRMDAQGNPVWWDDKKKIERQERYCLQDVRTEMAVAKKLRRLPDDEMAVYHLDQTINDRGVRIDVPLVEAMQRCVAAAKENLDARMAEATNGYASSATQTARITAFLQAGDPRITSLAKGALSDLLSDEDLPPSLREVIEIRAEGAKASVSKLAAMKSRANSDNRARGLYLYHGAGTGRFSSLGIQLQNLRRGKAKDYEPAIPAIMAEDVAYLDLFYGAIPETVSNLLRGCFIPSEGNVFHVADYANIEGRLVMWLAGQQSGVKAFEAYDAGTGPDNYKLTYASAFGKSVGAVTDEERQIGKVIALATGFGGSVGAFAKMAGLYNVNLARAAELAKANATEEEWDSAARGYQASSELDLETWTGLKVIVNKWRGANPDVVAMWYELVEGAVEAVKMPGTTIRTCHGRVRLRCKNNCLWVELPSGRLLCYYQPSVRKTQMPWHTDEKPALKDTVFFWGMKLLAPSGKLLWCEQAITVPILVENVVQGIARDLLVYALFQVEAAGYPTVMHSHDEIIADTPAGHGSLADFERLMRLKPAWAEGLPLATSGWSGPRYRK